MYAGVEYYVNPAGTAAAILTPLVGQGQIPDEPGFEGYPVTFSLTDLDGDGVMEWARYIEVDGQVRLLFVAEWQFVGGKGYETFPVPASGIFGASTDVTLILNPVIGGGAITLHGESVITAGGTIVSLPPGTYIEFVTTQTSATTIQTVGSLYVDYTLVADVTFRGTYVPNQSSWTVSTGGYGYVVP